MPAATGRQSWRQVGSPSALVDTRFGQLLLFKAVGVGLLLCLGQVSRRWTKRLWTRGDAGRTPYM